MGLGENKVREKEKESIEMIDNKKRPGKDLDRIDRNILNELQKMVVFQTLSYLNVLVYHQRLV